MIKVLSDLFFAIDSILSFRECFGTTGSLTHVIKSMFTESIGNNKCNEGVNLIANYFKKIGNESRFYRDQIEIY